MWSKMAGNEMPAVYFKQSYILDRDEIVEEGLDRRVTAAHSLQLCNVKSDVPNVVKEGTLIPFGTAQNALTGLCLALKSD